MFTMCKVAHLISLTLFKSTGKASDLSDSYNRSNYTAKKSII